jgi:DDE superfamily endonuclease
MRSVLVVELLVLLQRVRSSGSWRQVLDVLVSARRDAAAARRFLRRALSTLKVKPTEVVTDAVAVCPAVLDAADPAGFSTSARRVTQRRPCTPAGSPTITSSPPDRTRISRVSIRGGRAATFFLSIQGVRSEGGSA